MGIFLNSFFYFSQLIVLGILILGIIIISALWRHKKLAVIGFCILFLVLGIWRQQSAELGIKNNELRKYNDLDEKITLIGTASGEPEIKEKIIKLTIETENIDGNKIKGKILVTTNRYPEYQYGDKLKIIGKLKTPQILGEFNYRNYLKKDGIYSVMDWPDIESIGSDFGNPLMNVIFSFKNKFKENIRNFISPPQLGILEALVFGDEEKISKEWKDKLNFTGTRHLTAVSGMNITILTFLILTFILSLGFWRNQAFYITIFLLLLYILMIGAPPSAVRAGIMVSFVLVAQHFGRFSLAGRMIVFAATFMLIQNPFLLTLDIGFQLSFLAILGIVYFQPIFSELFSKIPNPPIFPLKSTLSTTLAAQTFTLPILVYNFGYVSSVSPLTNILIVPFLAPITILIFIFGLLSLLFLPLGYFLSWPTWLCLTYIVHIVDWFSKLPFASLFIKNTHWIFLAIVYLIFGLIIWRIQRRRELKFLQY